MAFSASSKNVRLEGAVLKATCSTKYGAHSKESSIDLNRLLGNIHGRFVWGAQAFSSSARNVHLDGAILHADLGKGDGSWGPTEINLDKLITNQDGQLVAINFPAAIAVPNGQSTQTAVDQLAEALDANKKYKISRASAGKETTVWFIDALDEHKTSIFFKTFDLHTTLAFTRIIEYKEREIHEISADEAAKKTGANAPYLEAAGIAFAPYAGVNAHLPLVKAHDSTFTIQGTKGKQAETAQPSGSIDTRLDGCGTTIGKRVSAIVIGEHIQVAYKKFFD